MPHTNSRIDLRDLHDLRGLEKLDKLKLDNVPESQQPSLRRESRQPGDQHRISALAELAWNGHRAGDTGRPWQIEHLVSQALPHLAVAILFDDDGPPSPLSHL